MAKETKRATAPRKLKPEASGMDTHAVMQSVLKRLMYSLGKESTTATDRDWYSSLAYAVRDRLMSRWIATQTSYYNTDCKRVYYLSLEFLIGRSLSNAVLNLDIEKEVREVLMELGHDLEKIREREWDAALGNGGLGRLAACFLDSMATLGLPGTGYGIRYDYGMFYQEIKEGEQIEHPDNWLRYGNCWEFPRPEITYPVHFGGHVVSYKDETGNTRYRWTDQDTVLAMAYDTPIPGNNGETVNFLRLWSAKATSEFNLQLFNVGDYIKAVGDKNDSENLSRVLYPDDTTERGRTLRLMQQYFFVTASLQDILRRYLKVHTGFDDLPSKAAIQLNDTHPTLAIPELMRILMDQYNLNWDHAWKITTQVFSYTNHTLLPEALETWPVHMFERLLPRHLQIVYEINHRFMHDVMHRHPGDAARLRRMSLIDEEGARRIRMGHLAVVGSHKVNGVAALHSNIMRETIFADFDEHFPGKFTNVTNGITPRRWCKEANPGLATLITDKIGRGWENNLSELTKLLPYANDAAFRKEFAAVKMANKKRLAGIIEERLGITVPVNAMFDVQVKRIHEYKRQLLNLLHVITRYNRIRRNPNGDYVPRVVVFAGKAAPGYYMAKRIIKLINCVADVVNNDPAVHDKLKLIFLPNYDVTTAQNIMPAANLSEQISTAGMEASGTGNMKLQLNGAITMGTLDGANVEILEEVGAENIFIFGLTAAEVAAERARGYYPRAIYESNWELREVLDMISSGYFSPDWPDQFRPIIDHILRDNEHFLVLADYAAYIKAQEQADELYLNQEEWTRKAIINTAKVGKFSSDRSIQEYADRIWNVKSVKPSK
jgi:glycogen phosphorylase